jgi:hypothetical protein
MYYKKLKFFIMIGDILSSSCYIEYNWRNNQGYTNFLPTNEKEVRAQSAKHWIGHKKELDFVLIETAITRGHP